MTIDLYAKDLHRALDVAAQPARKADENLRCVCVETTNKGLTVTGTDRYWIAQTRAEYFGETPETGLPKLLLDVADLKPVLAVLKADPNSPVSLTVDGDNVSARMLYNGATCLLRSRSDIQFPDLKRILAGPAEVAGEANGFAIAPSFVKELTMMAARHGNKNEALRFAFHASGVARPIQFAFDNWLRGAIMPVRMEGAPLEKAAEWADATALPEPAQDKAETEAEAA